VRRKEGKERKAISDRCRLLNAETQSTQRRQEEKEQQEKEQMRGRQHHYGCLIDGPAKRARDWTEVRRVKVNSGGERDAERRAAVSETGA